MLKKILCVGIVAILALALSACNNLNNSSSDSSKIETTSENSDNGLSNVSDIVDKVDEIEVSAVSGAVLDAIEFPDMSLLDAERLDFFYEVPLDIIESYSVSICGSAGFPDEVAVFKLKDVSDMPALEEAISKRVDALSAAFTDYRPEEHKKIDDCIVESYGSYACLVVSSDNDNARKIILDYFS
ncbi:MAG TPA: DUF4358 domain-containing protein [Oscillospiraceae bacterium]|nr:DUF4358 domain-containing protein [Oscillospiraceae bacterium]